MRPSNPSQALALCLVDELARGGVTHACLAPGSRSAPLALALASDDRIRVHVTLDERSAAFVALGLAKASGRAAVVVSTSGTAAANFFPAVIEAHQQRVPMIVLTADRPPELRQTGANQTIDQVKLYGDAVRWFCEMGAPEDLPASPPYWRSTAVRALATAEGSPPGPAHLNVAFREPLVPSTSRSFKTRIEGRPKGRAWAEHTQGIRRLDEARLVTLAEELTAADGVIVAGAGVRAPDAVVKLAETLGWPLLADPLSGARQGSNAISSYNALLRHAPFADEQRPHIALRFGALGISKALTEWLRAVPRHVLVDPDGWWVDPTRSVDELIHADEAAFCDGLIGRLEGPTDGSRLKLWVDADQRARAAIAEELKGTKQLTEPAVARELVAALPRGSDLVVAASMPFRDIEWFSEPRADLRFFGNRGANGIDGFLSTALGVAMASERPAYALCGDLSLLHDQNGFLSQETTGTQLTIVVVNNDGGGIFSFLPQASLPDHFEELFGTPHGLDLRRLAELHGLHHDLAKTPSELRWALEHRGGIRIVEVRTERAENVAIHQRLNRAVAARLGS
ncbi:MAG: 2-succinyl-5-enolpyruvyl-6-hydroxy-3-cyclohexene-1-carboxylic-acid synthase [Actinomycetota bacterium]